CWRRSRYGFSLTSPRINGLAAAAAQGRPTEPTCIHRLQPGTDRLLAGGTRSCEEPDTTAAQDEAMTKNGLTYAEAGVDIDAGNLMVEKIKPAVRSTRRPGADGEIGGFGGLFDLKAAGFSDPVLVAANDGVGTKLKIAIDAG